MVFEDEHLLVVNKAAGMVAHPSPGHATGTLVNALLHRFQLPALRLNAEGLAVLSVDGVPLLLLITEGSLPSVAHNNPKERLCVLVSPMNTTGIQTCFVERTAEDAHEEEEGEDEDCRGGLRSQWELPGSLQGHVLRPGIVHRLDKGTTGLLVVAKDGITLAGLAAQFKAHTVHSDPL